MILIQLCSNISKAMISKVNYNLNKNTPMTFKGSSKSAATFLRGMPDFTKINMLQHRVIMGVTALSIQPLIDYNNKSVDEDTRKSSAAKTALKIIIGTTIGTIVRLAVSKPAENLFHKVIVDKTIENIKTYLSTNPGISTGEIDKITDGVLSLKEFKDNNPLSHLKSTFVPAGSSEKANIKDVLLKEIVTYYDSFCRNIEKADFDKYAKKTKAAIRNLFKEKAPTCIKFCGGFSDVIAITAVVIEIFTLDRSAMNFCLSKAMKILNIAPKNEEKKKEGKK